MVSTVSTEYGRVSTDAEQDTFLGGYPVLAVNVLIMLLLTSLAARTWSRRTAQDRRDRRRGVRTGARGLPAAADPVPVAAGDPT